MNLIKNQQFAYVINNINFVCFIKKQKTNSNLLIMRKLYYILFLSLFVLITTETSAQNWAQIGVDIDGETAGDKSGNSVSLNSDGSVVAIGAPENDGNGSISGHVRVYENQSGTWTQIGADIDGEAIDDRFGSSVSLNSDGSIVAIGAVSNDGAGSNAGHVRIYENQSGTWTQIGADIDGEAAGDQLGWSVNLNSDGSIVAIGANDNDGAGSNAGHVRIYKNQSGTWTQIGADIDGEAAGDESGYSVSLSSDGSIVAIGSRNNDGNGSNAGHVRIYENQSGTWTQIGADINGEAAGDESGSSVSLSSDGSVVAIGAYRNAGNGSEAGHVRIYQNQSGTWTQIGADINGEAAGDWSGYSLNLSSDGSVVAIGSLFNDGAYLSPGHVIIYQNQSGIWTQIGSAINGEADEDVFGASVGLSSDGSIVAIGAVNNDGNGSNAGHVRVYSRTPNNPKALEATNITSTSFTANWEAETDVTGYYIDVDNNGDFSSPISQYNNLDVGNVTSYNISGLTESTEYFYRVRAYTLVPSDNSNIISVSTIVNGISDAAIQNISIFPNPTNGILKFDLSGNNVQKIKISDITGKTVFEKVNIDQNETIDLSGFANGIYVVILQTENGILSSKIIKE